VIKTKNGNLRTSKTIKYFAVTTRSRKGRKPEIGKMLPFTGKAGKEMVKKAGSGKTKNGLRRLKGDSVREREHLYVIYRAQGCPVVGVVD